MPRNNAVQNSAGWCFTCNNYTEVHCAKVQSFADNCKYIVCGKEIAPTTGTPHLQGYIHWKDSKSLPATIAAFGHGFSFIKATGSAAQNQIYCSKENLWFEWGVPPKSPKEKGEQERLFI